MLTHDWVSTGLPANLKPTFINLGSQHIEGTADSKSRFHSLFPESCPVLFFSTGNSCRFQETTYLSSSPFPVSIWIVFHKSDLLIVLPPSFLECCLSQDHRCLSIETRSHRKNVCQTSVNSCSIPNMTLMAPAFWLFNLLEVQGTKIKLLS